MLPRARRSSEAWYAVAHSRRPFIGPLTGFASLPVCVAKTHLSFTDDPKAGGLAEGFTPTVTELRLAAGAGFVVALMGRIFTMPGLPREPAARHVRVEPNGRIRGLMQGG